MKWEARVSYRPTPWNWRTKCPSVSWSNYCYSWSVPCLNIHYVQFILPSSTTFYNAHDPA